MEPRTLALFPFLPEVSVYLRQQGVSLDDIISSPTYGRARELGRERVMEAFLEKEVREHPMTSDIDYLLEILSYIVARMIVSSTADEMLIEQYALAEAVSTRKRLADQDMDFLSHITEALEINASLEEDEQMRIHFTDYLKLSSQMRAKEWSLVSQDLDAGYLVLEKKKIIRLVQQALSDRIKKELPLPVNDDIIDAFTSTIDDLRIEVEKRKEEFRKEGFGRISFLRLPPCMKIMLNGLKKGENLPHAGRFALTAFLHTVGMDTEQILALYSTSPDFNVNLARYQIEHITGKLSGVEYLPQSCHTMVSQGICFEPDSLCKKEWMTHPLSYYKIKGKKRDGGKGSSKSAPKDNKPPTDDSQAS
ncbi:MAG: DNA primase large subunit PriL [Thermoplasmata archaeon]|nr:DNA primase large subunit PriL [Thermoplasmata archaeon]